MVNKQDLRVAIIGGGYGGAAAAVALHNIGIKADLYEQAPEIGEVGAGIGLRPPSIHCFKEWGIYDAVKKVSTESQYMAVLKGNGEVIVKERWPLLTDNKDERWSRLIHRADFIEVFMDHIPAENVHLGHKCEKVIEHDDYVEVHFENGKKIEVDLVIGADGIRSNIRKQFISDAEPVPAKAHAYRAVVDNWDQFGFENDNIFRVYVEGDAMIYLLPLEHRNQVSFDVTVKSEDTSWVPEVTNEQILDIVRNFEPRLQKIAETLTIEDYTCRSLFDIEPLDNWSTNRITLLGDAAHAMLHHQGSGANMAIQDAKALADALRNADTIPEALKKYQEERMPITREYQRLSRQEPTHESTTAFPEKEKFDKEVAKQAQ